VVDVKKRKRKTEKEMVGYAIKNDVRAAGVCVEYVENRDSV